MSFNTFPRQVFYTSSGTSFNTYPGKHWINRRRIKALKLKEQLTQNRPDEKKPNIGLSKPKS